MLSKINLYYVEEIICNGNEEVMKQHKVLIAISVGLLVLLLALGFVFRSVFFSGGASDNQMQVANRAVGTEMPNQLADGQLMTDSTTEEGSVVYSTFSLYEQAPVSVNGKAQLKTDQQYFYNAEMGKIASVQVRDGQYVKENDVLFAYEIDSKQAQYDVEDALREQTRLYNQREEILKQLTQLTGYDYNYQGDKISNFWDYSGKQAYYIEEEIGDSTTGEDGVDTSSEEAALKEQIRQANQQIEDVEIKLIRLKEQQHGRIQAKISGTVILNEAGRENNQVPFIRIISDDISVVGSVSEYEFYTLAEGRPVNLYINAEDREVAGDILSFDQYPVAVAASDTGQPTNAMPGTSTGSSQYNFIIKAEEYIQPGFSVKIGIQLPGVVVPTEAIIEEAGQTYVFVYQEGTVEKRAVTIERQGTNRVVHRELSHGETLVLHPYDLQDGQNITTDFDIMGLDNGQGMTEGNW